MHGSFYRFLAGATVVDLDEVLGHGGFDFRNVLNEAFSGRTGFSQRIGAIGTMRKRMDLGLIISFWEASPNAWMALFPSRSLPAGFRRRLLIGRFHPRGSRRVLMGTLSLKRFLKGFVFLIQFKELFDRKLFTGAI